MQAQEGDFLCFGRETCSPLAVSAEVGMRKAGTPVRDLQNTVRRYAVLQLGGGLMEQ